MHGDHLCWPVGSALKAGGQALGPLPYAGDENGFSARAEQHPLLLGKAPLRSGHNAGWAQFFFFFSINECTTEHTMGRRQVLWDAWCVSIATSHAITRGKSFY